MHIFLLSGLDGYFLVSCRGALRSLDLVWYRMMLFLAVSDQRNLAGPNFLKMQTRHVWVFSLEISILPLLTPWRAVGVDPPACFTGKRRVSGRHRD